MLPKIRRGHWFRRVESRPHVLHMRLVRGIDERTTRTEGVDSNEMMRSMAVVHEESGTYKTAGFFNFRRTYYF